VEFEALRGLLRRVAEEVEAEIKQMEKELAEARRGGGRGSWPLLETSCTRTSALGLRRPSTPKSRGNSPKAQRRGRLLRRLRGGSSALGLRWWRCFC
jgi:hypothetical protein